ncbi:hypothetical protein Tco_1044001 [Tanacetum coccineum]|uniref:Uncharacterized protein n=1 Tax=Tanacetum coccineum TaxID=301880 RepID=A0ABQ5GPY5_9ASTR
MSNLRRIQVKDNIKEVDDYLKTYLSARMDISHAFTTLSNLHNSQNVMEGIQLKNLEEMIIDQLTERKIFNDFKLGDVKYKLKNANKDSVVGSEVSTAYRSKDTYAVTNYENENVGLIDVKDPNNFFDQEIFDDGERQRMRELIKDRSHHDWYIGTSDNDDNLDYL